MHPQWLAEVSGNVDGLLMSAQLRTGRILSFSSSQGSVWKPLELETIGAFIQHKGTTGMCLITLSIQSGLEKHFSLWLAIYYCYFIYQSAEVLECCSHAIQIYLKQIKTGICAFFMLRIDAASGARKNYSHRNSSHSAVVSKLSYVWLRDCLI